MELWRRIVRLRTEGSAEVGKPWHLQRDPNRHRSRWCRQHPQQWVISVNDTQPPIPKIDVGSPPSAITDPYTLLTSQRVQFSAARSDDNVPLNQLIFTWDFGDGTVVSGQGLYEISHEWTVGSANGTEYILTLYVDDGTHLANMTVSILIENRIPVKFGTKICKRPR